MDDIISLSNQLGIEKEEHRLIILHLYDIENNKRKIDYIEYSSGSWVYKEHDELSCIYYEDNTKLIRIYGRE